jgi:hypothetical protein
MPAPPKVIASVCMSGDVAIGTSPMPSDALIVTSQDGEKVDFTVSQQWVEEGGIAVNLNGPTLESSCVIMGNVTLGDSEDFEGECTEGITAVTIVVYMEQEFDPEECEACNVDDLSQMGGTFCAYRVEIPCETISVECGEPSAAPSGSYFPSSAPSESPTESSKPSSSPTGSPSASPSGSPSVEPSASPTRSPTNSPSNSPSDSPTVAPSTFEPTYAEAELFFPTPEPSTAPSGTPTKCPRDDPILIDINGSTMYPEGAPPIEITFQNTTHVGFKVINTWDTTFTNVYTEYHEGGFGETECLEEENVESHTEVEEYMATCMHNVPISIVNVWVVDANETWFDEVDDAEVPECCHPPEFSQVPIVQYSFKLSCVNPCPEEEENPVVVTPEVSVPARRLHNKKKDENINDIASAEAFKHTTKRKISNSSTASMNEPSSDGKDGHFCVSEDYPCGEDIARVHVCHYSARDGYKTFCVPETDSDVLAFYKKDYCGPCVGGYGSKIKR